MPILGSLAGASTRGFGFGGGSADLVYLDEGAMIPLTSVLVNSTVGTIDIENIPSTYKHLVIRGNLLCSAETSVNVRFNTDSANNYMFQQIYAGSMAVTTDSNSGTSSAFIGYSVSSTFPASFTAYIGNYASTSQYKSWVSYSGAMNDSSSAYSLFTTGAWRNSSTAINKITFTTGAVNMLAKSTLHVYGLKGA